MYFSEYGLSPTFPAKCKATNEGSHRKFCFDETSNKQTFYTFYSAWRFRNVIQVWKRKTLFMRSDAKAFVSFNKQPIFYSKSEFSIQKALAHIRCISCKAGAC